jgi:hypothetical protein
MVHQFEAKSRVMPSSMSVVVSIAGWFEFPVGPPSCGRFVFSHSTLNPHRSWERKPMTYSLINILIISRICGASHSSHYPLHHHDIIQSLSRWVSWLVQDPIPLIFLIICHILPYHYHISLENPLVIFMKMVTIPQYPIMRSDVCMTMHVLHWFVQLWPLSTYNPIYRMYNPIEITSYKW